MSTLLLIIVIIIGSLQTVNFKENSNLGSDLDLLDRSRESCLGQETRDSGARPLCVDKKVNEGPEVDRVDN